MVETKIYVFYSGFEHDKNDFIVFKVISKLLIGSFAT